MTCKKLCAPVFFAAVGLAVVVGSLAIADPAKESVPAKEAKPAAGQTEMKLPPGWTDEDVKLCMAAATPGKMHEFLAKGTGIWQGKLSMWMAPGTEALKSDCTSTITAIMDGRFTKCEIAGDVAGMGPFSGLGLYGFDNVSQKFTSTWIDNQGTGMMNGTGELSADSKVLTWKYMYNCPIQKKPVMMREIETITGPDTRTLEMFGPEPKSSKEYKMMSIEFTKKK